MTQPESRSRAVTAPTTDQPRNDHAEEAPNLRGLATRSSRSVTRRDPVECGGRRRGATPPAHTASRAMSRPSGGASQSLRTRRGGSLLDAENTGGIVVSVATLADPWYASQKTGLPAVAPGVREQVQATVSPQPPS